jgi:RimJ/RimL family protein N-acetyltransferase
MITGKKVRLRAVERDDLPKICQWLNDEEVMYYWGDPGSTVSLAGVERWFDEALEGSRHLSQIPDRKTYDIAPLGLSPSINSTRTMRYCGEPI